MLSHKWEAKLSSAFNQLILINNGQPLEFNSRFINRRIKSEYAAFLLSSLTSAAIALIRLHKLRCGKSWIAVVKSNWKKNPLQLY